MTIWTFKNAPEAKCFDVDTEQQINRVVQVDDVENTLLCSHDPVRVVGDEFETFKVEYEKITTVFKDVEKGPSAFFCCGRKEAA